jgi:predicted transposase YbfD/YdcC
MQYTEPQVLATTGAAQVRLPLPSIHAAFAALPDPRRGNHKDYSLASLLTLTVAAVLCNSLSLLAVAEWGQRQSAAVRAALGLPPDRTPHQTTLHRLFRQLDPQLLSHALQHYFDPPARPNERQRGAQGIALDGKCHRGAVQFTAATTGPTHELTAFCQEMGVALTQLAFQNQAAESELHAAPTLIAALNWQGRVLTGDAAFCQTALCEQVLAAGGDYAIVVKGNQPTLHEDLQVLFAAPEMQSARAARQAGFEYRETTVVNKGHGRLEVRHAVASTELTGYTAWPGLAQVVAVTRRWQRKGVWQQATQYLVTSLPPEVAPVARLLELKRGHWGIENRLHYVKDVTLGEDRSLIHVGYGGAVLGVVRSAAVSILHHHGIQRIAATLRAHSQDPATVLALLGLISNA